MHVEEIEKATVTFESEGHKVKMDLTVMGDEINVHLTAENPDNLNEQKGIHIFFANIFTNALKEE